MIRSLSIVIYLRCTKPAKKCHIWCVNMIV
nr:MAG TPA: matrix protein [Caudoviricetes sp.]